HRRAPRPPRRGLPARPPRLGGGIPGCAVRRRDRDRGSFPHARRGLEPAAPMGDPAKASRKALVRRGDPGEPPTVVWRGARRGVRRRFAPRGGELALPAAARARSRRRPTVRLFPSGRPAARAGPRPRGGGALLGGTLRAAHVVARPEPLRGPRNPDSAALGIGADGGVAAPGGGNGLGAGGDEKVPATVLGKEGFPARVVRHGVQSAPGEAVEKGLLAVVGRFALRGSPPDVLAVLREVAGAA